MPLRKHNFELLNQHFLQNKDEIYIACYDQFLQLKVNNNMLRSVLTINGQLQHMCDQFCTLR
jgi:hypothetical protein